MVAGAEGGNDEEDDEDIDWSSEARAAALQEADEAKRLKTPRLGIDFGNVIAANDEDGLVRRRADGTVDRCAQPCAGAVDGVKALVRLFKCEHVFIVSKARSRVAERTLEWLEESGFLKETGLLGGEGHIFFVCGRVDKRPIVEALGITHFIDDRMSVLRSLTKCVQRVLMCGPWVTHDDRHDRGDRNGRAMPGKVVAQNWPEVVGAVRKWFKTRGTPGGAKSSQITDSPNTAVKKLWASVAAPEMAATRTAAGAYLPLGDDGSYGGPLLEGHTLGSVSVVPWMEGTPVPERCAWLEHDLEQLRAYAYRLYQAVSRLEGDSRSLDMQLNSSEAENFSLLARISELEAMPDSTSRSPYLGGAVVALEATAEVLPLSSMIPETPARAPSPSAAALPGETPGPSPWRAPLTPACAPPAYPAPIAALDFGEAPVVPPAAIPAALGAASGEWPAVPEAPALPPVPLGEAAATLADGGAAAASARTAESEPPVAAPNEADQ